MTASRLTVDIWSDVVCPWCYIGKRRFEAALSRFEHRDDVSVMWHSFELDPDAPPVHEGAPAERLAGEVRHERRRRRRRARRRSPTSRRWRAWLRPRGRARGQHVRRAPPHPPRRRARPRRCGGGAPHARLLHRGRADRRPHGARAPRHRRRPARGRGPRRRSTATATPTPSAPTSARPTQLGIRGVPFFVLDRKYGLSGAQPADVILQALEQAWREAAPAAA